MDETSIVEATVDGRLSADVLTEKRMLLVRQFLSKNRIESCDNVSPVEGIFVELIVNCVVVVDTASMKYHKHYKYTF